jgi:tRNA pseudouridine55 synthase
VKAAADRPRAGAPAAPVFHGLLALDKPTGMTSHDVVVRVRRRLASPGAGHLGTLDPGASGLLVIALGAATRALPVWQGGEKTYEATLRLGVVTRSQDLDGEVLERRPVEVSEARLREAARAFTGDLDQIPPMVSAVKVGGRRLHTLARRGVDVERRPRRIHVASWEWLEVTIPEATFRVRCSAGTYVRTLAHDLGAALGTGAALASLRRLRSEPFGLEQAITLADLERVPPAEALARAGTPLDEALRTVPAVTLDEAGARVIGAGGRPVLARPAGAPVAAGPRSVVLRDGVGRALALGELGADATRPEHVIVCPHVVFPWAVREGRP